MRPIKQSYTPADDDTNGFATGVNAAAGAPLTLAANDAGDSMGHKVIISPSGAVSGNYTLTGTDPQGNTLTETLATDNANAVTSTNFFLTLTEVLAATLGAETVDIGWTDDVVSPMIPLSWRASQGQFQVSLGVDITGTIDYTVQHTFDDIRTTDFDALTWWPHASIVAKTADADGNYEFPCVATRVLVNSLTAGATLAFFVVQGA